MKQAAAHGRRSMTRAGVHGMLLALLVVGGAWAGGSELLRHEGVKSFASGEMDHVALSSDGRLLLSPAHEKATDLEDSVAWSVASGPDGTAWVGTGHDGKVWRLAPGAQEPELVFDAEELEVLAIAVSPEGQVHCATSPEGQVYRLMSDGEAEVVFDPEERYVWDLHFDAEGRLLVATGDPAGVYRLQADAEPERLLEADETHVLELLTSPEGLIYAGTGGDGYVYRIHGEEAFVMLDTEAAEVKGLVLDDTGALWVAASGRRGSEVAALPPPPPQPAPTPQPQANASGQTLLEEVQAGTAPAQPATTATQQPVRLALGGPPFSKVFRLGPGEPPEVLWGSSQTNIYALAWHDGQALLATGEEGRILSLDDRGRISVLIDLPAAQVTDLAPTDEGGLLATVSNLAALYRLNGRLAAEGSFTSSVIDAKTHSNWGRIDVESQGDVRVETRSGNTARPGQAWSEWVTVDADVPSPQARYLQYRLLLEPGRTPPEVRAVDLSYLPANRPPRLTQITVLEPHHELRSSGPRPDNSARRSYLGRTRQNGSGTPAMPPPSPPEQESYGMRAARWSSEDPDGDPLTFKLEYRGLDESAFKLLASDIEEPFFSWDETAMPDGTYVLRATASDAAANIAERARETSLESESFLVDLTPPSVTIHSKKVRRGTAQFVVHARDSASRVTDAEYSLDGRDWMLTLPADGVFDEQEEELPVELQELEPGEHTLVVRAADQARNVGSAKIVFDVR